MHESSKQNTIETTIIRMNLEDGTSKSLKAPIKPKAIYLFKLFMDRLGWFPQDYKYFWICEKKTDEFGKLIDRWFEMDETIEVNEVFMKQKIVKQCKDLSKEYAEMLIWAQSCNDIVSEKVPCKEKLAVQLAVLKLQKEFGDFDPRIHRVGFLNGIDLGEYLPPTVSPHDYQYWQNRLFGLYKEKRGMSRYEALIRYVVLVRSNPYFGISLYNVKTMEGEIITMGIGEDGMYIFDAETMALVKRFQFKEILSWDFIRGGFTVSLGNNVEMNIQTISWKATEIIKFLDEYYFVLPVSRKSSLIQPNQSNPNILLKYLDFEMIIPRVFTLLPFDSRLEYIKSIYFSIEDSTIIQNFCKVLDFHIDRNLTLSNFDLSDSRIGERRIETIVTVLQQSLQYQTDEGSDGVRNFTENLDVSILNLAGNRIPNFCLHHVSTLFSLFPNITEFNMSDSPLESSGAKKLARFLSKLENLEKITLSGCKIGNKGFRSILEETSKVKKLRYIDFSRNYVGSWVFQTYFRSFSKENDLLEYIDLSHNLIGTQGIRSFSKCLKRSKAIREIRFNSNPVAHGDVKYFVHLIKFCPNIEKIHIEHSKLSVDAFVRLGAALTRNDCIKILNFSNNPLGFKLNLQLSKDFCGFLHFKETKLEEINFDGLQTGEVFGEVFATSLLKNRILKKLHFGSNQLGLSLGGLPEIWGETLSLNQALQYLDMKNNGIKESGMELIFTHSVKHKTLKTIILSQNRLKTMSNQVLTSFFSQCRMENIEINQCKLSSDHLHAIGLGLSTNGNRISNLSLRDNRFSYFGIEKFLKAVGKIPQIHTLDLTDEKERFRLDEKKKEEAMMNLSATHAPGILFLKLSNLSNLPNESP